MEITLNPTLWALALVAVAPIIWTIVSRRWLLGLIEFAGFCVGYIQGLFGSDE